MYVNVSVAVSPGASASYAPAFGVYVTVPSGLIATVPLAPSDTPATLSAPPSTSVAVARTSSVTEPPSSSASPAADPVRTGASLTAATSTVTVAVVAKPALSVTT